MNQGGGFKAGMSFSTGGNNGQSTGFGNTSGNTSGFGNTNSGLGFGNNGNNTGFNTGSNTTGNTTFGGGNTNKSGTSSFGGGFGNNTNTNSTSSLGSGFGNNTNSTFGGNTTTGQTSGFGFNSNNKTGTTGTTGFGGNTSTTGFGGNTSTTGFGGSTSTTGFGGTTGTTGFGGTTGTTGFGGNTSTTGFGSTNKTGTAFGSGTTGFGGNTSTTGFGTTNKTGTTFGSGTAFGSNNTAFGSNNNTGSAFGSNNTGFGSNNTGFGMNNNNQMQTQQQSTMMNISENKEVIEQMNKRVEELDPAIQTMIKEIIGLMNNQQKMIDSIGIPDNSSSQDTLQSLQDLQFECEKIKASQDLYCMQLEKLQALQTRYETFVSHIQQTTKRDSNETDSSLYHDKKQAPSTFFEEILHELSMKVSSITEKIENMEMMLSIRSIDLKNEKEAMNKELSDTERLLDVLEREFNQFLIQSAAVGELVKKMEEVKKQFLVLRNKEIETRRKNMTLMVSMNDVLANVLDDPFKEIANDYTK